MVHGGQVAAGSNVSVAAAIGQDGSAHASGLADWYAEQESSFWFNGREAIEHTDTLRSGPE